jgi:hypothetical protein
MVSLFGMRLTLIALLLLTLSCGSRHAQVPVPALKSTTGYLDLRPGIRFSVEKAYYTPGATGRGLTGYLGTRLATFGFQPDGALQLVSQESKPFNDTPAKQLPSEPLLPSYMKGKQSYRFFYAITFARSGRPSASVLLRAKSAKAMEDLSARLQAAPDEVCSPQSDRCTVFPEGSTVSISMEIVVNGTPKVVIWGSSLGSVTGGRPATSLERTTSGRLESLRSGLTTPLLPGDRISF